MLTVRTLLAALLWVAILPLTAHAGGHRTARTVLLVGSPSPAVERTIRAGLDRRGIRVVIPSVLSDGALELRAAPGRARAALKRARELFYAAQPSEAALLLQREARRSGRELALARRLDLLRDLHFWEGISRAKGGDRVGSSHAFTRAIMIDPRPPDEIRFPPEVQEAFETARETLVRRAPGTLVLEVRPSNAAIIIDGRRVKAARVDLPPGQHWVVVVALGRSPLVREVLIASRQVRSLELGLFTADRKTTLQQLRRLRREGKLNTTKPEVAAALGRVHDAAGVLMVRETRLKGRLRLSLTRLRSTDGRTQGRHVETVPSQEVTAAARRALDALWLTSSTSRPFYSRWWFWTAVGVVVAGGVVAGIVVAEAPPDTYTFRLP